MKLLNIIKESVGEEENDTSFLDKKFYRQALNYIHNNYYNPPTIKETTLLIDDDHYSQLSHKLSGLRRFIIDEFSGLKRDDILIILFLYVLNQNVKNYLTEPLNTGEGYNLYSVSYNGPLDEDEEEEEEECDNCQGSGSIESECEECEGSGRIEVDGEWEECSVCQGDGVKEIECKDCDGYGADRYTYTIYEIRNWESVIIVNGELNEIDYSDDETTIKSWIKKNTKRGFIWNSDVVSEEREEYKDHLSDPPETITQIEHIPINKLSLSNMLIY
jgi:hypothetical protein